jgi:hypothetical protein
VLANTPPVTPAPAPQQPTQDGPTISAGSKVNAWRDPSSGSDDNHCDNGHSDDRHDDASRDRDYDHDRGWGHGDAHGWSDHR